MERSGALDGIAAGLLAGLFTFAGDGVALPRSGAVGRAALVDGLASGRLTVGAAALAAGLAADVALAALLLASAAFPWPSA